ncbi:BnaA03g13160D [Brassica napus]|uniref:(rape) hypothetical protein n=1 Tax=Brassica napus TaxID=3708 RepID=A0A078HPZ7_BRANA|nr:unnamed protein product [Brassica napus]CDY38863.1 BnaA03g13160D [Brassica napus]
MPCLHDAIDVNTIRVIEFPIAENAKGLTSLVRIK